MACLGVNQTDMLILNARQPDEVVHHGTGNDKWRILALTVDDKVIIIIGENSVVFLIPD